jgi:uncharacterized protein
VRRFLILLLLASWPAFSYGLDFPPAPTVRVNDYAGVLQPQEKEELESILRQHETETSNQIVVAIFPTLEQESLEDYVNRLFENWKIGQKMNNNGVLLVVFLQERQIRIEVGYGLEGKLTDALSSRIIRNEIAPDFRAGKYGSGIRKAVLAIQQAIAGEYNPVAQPQQPNGPTFSPGAVFIGMMVFLYIIYRARNRGVYIDPKGRKRYRDNDWFIFPGGGWGSGGGGGGWGGGGGGGFSGGGGMSGGGGASGSW